MKTIICPQCRKDFVKRTHRSGAFEHLVSLAYVYPFRCQLCGYRFRALQWGVRYKRFAVDRREYYRLTVHIPMVLVDEHGNIFGKTYDLSLGGCAMDAPMSIPEGSLIGVQLQVPDERTPITVDTAVVRSSRLGRIGVEFLRFTPAEKVRLNHFIEQEWKTRLLKSNVDVHRLNEGRAYAETYVQPPNLGLSH